MKAKLIRSLLVGFKIIEVTTFNAVHVPEIPASNK